MTTMTRYEMFKALFEPRHGWYGEQHAQEAFAEWEIEQNPPEKAKVIIDYEDGRRSFRDVTSQPDWAEDERIVEVPWKTLAFWRAASDVDRVVQCQLRELDDEPWKKKKKESGA